MLLLNRRHFLLSASAATAALTGCGFSPVYKTGGAGQKLQNRIYIEPPKKIDTYQLTRQLETRLGRHDDPAPMTLSYTLRRTKASLGRTTTGSTTRFHFEGTLRYSLRDGTSGEVLHKGSVKSFTGYSSAGNTAATLAAERNAEERLMTLLADRLVEELQLLDPERLP